MIISDDTRRSNPLGRPLGAAETTSLRRFEYNLTGEARIFLFESAASH
jgi:hypothetical protein